MCCMLVVPAFVAVDLAVQPLLPAFDQLLEHIAVLLCLLEYLQ